MQDIDIRIQELDRTICDNIDLIDFTSRGLVSQNMLSQSRHLLEHIAMKAYNQKYNLIVDYPDIETVIPFQVSYAVSIHKAQGLEYDSVKIVITEDIDEMITHNIFYTAITRTKNLLKIYWSPESQEKIISNFEKLDLSNEANIFAAQTGLKKVKVKR